MLHCLLPTTWVPALQTPNVMTDREFMPIALHHASRTQFCTCMQALPLLGYNQFCTWYARVSTIDKGSRIHSVLFQALAVLHQLVESVAFPSLAPIQTCNCNPPP